MHTSSAYNMQWRMRHSAHSWETTLPIEVTGHSSSSEDGRHPWIDSLISEPEAEVRRLLSGTAAVWPYHRAEPADAVSMIFADLHPDDPAFPALAQGLRVWFEKARNHRPNDDLSREMSVLQ